MLLVDVWETDYVALGNGLSLLLHCKQHEVRSHVSQSLTYPSTSQYAVVTQEMSTDLQDSKIELEARWQSMKSLIFLRL